VERSRLPFAALGAGRYVGGLVCVVVFSAGLSEVELFCWPGGGSTPSYTQMSRMSSCRVFLSVRMPRLPASFWSSSSLSLLRPAGKLLDLSFSFAASFRYNLSWSTVWAFARALSQPSSSTAFSTSCAFLMYQMLSARVPILLRNSTT